MHKHRKDRTHTIRNADGSLRGVEITLLTRFGQQTGTGDYVMSREVARAEIDRRRREIAALERLGRAGIAYRLDS